MLRHSVIKAVALGALLASALAASARTRPHYGGTLRIETQGDPWQLPDGLARRLVLDTLTTLSDTGQPQPALATAWQSDDTAHRWLLTIRTNVRFHDGTPLTPAIVAASLQASCSAEGTTPCPWTSVRPLATSVLFLTNAPLPDLPELLAQTRFAISRQQASGALDGTGPFRVIGFMDGSLNLAANDDCWQGRPFLDAIQIVPHRSIPDQWLDLSVGRADVVEVPPEFLRQAQDQHLNILASRPADLLGLTIAPPGRLADLPIRRSIALAVDRAALANVIFQRQSEISASLLPGWLSGYAFLFSPARDLARARILRGGANLPPLPLNIEDPSPSMQLAASRIALNLHEAGFNIPIAPSGSLDAPLQLRRIHLAATSPRAALDEMLAQLGQNVTVTGTAPESLYQAERSALSAATVVPLLWLPRAWATGERVRDLRLSPDGLPLLANASLVDSQSADISGGAR